MLRTTAAGLVTLAAMWGCGPGASSSGAAGDTVAVALPDLTAMHPAVQTQLRDAHAAIAAADGDTARAADAYGALGRLLLAGGHLDPAAEAFRAARRQAPRDPRWPYYLGYVRVRQGDLPRAVDRFDAVLELRPGDVPALVRLIEAHLDLGRPDAAAPLLARLERQRPGDQVVRFLQGRAAVAAQDYAAAVEHLEAALALDPAATVIHYPLAMAYRGLGEVERAERHLAQSGGQAGGGFSVGVTMTLEDPLLAELDTALASPQRFRRLALRADADGDPAEAARLFRQAVDMEPADAVLRLSLGLALERAGNARAALRELEEAVRLDPELAPAHYALGRLFERGGHDTEAIARYTAAVTHDPGAPDMHQRLADALRRTGRLEASLAHYREVLALEPTAAAAEAARYGEALALTRLGRHRDARARLAQGVERYPGSAAWAIALARLLAASPDARVRDGRRAFALIDAVVQTQKTTAVAETMAMALAELGEFRGAVEWQEVAIDVARDAGRPDIAADMSASLAAYRRGEPWRTPWRDDEPEYRPGPVVEPGLLGPRAASGR